MRTILIATLCLLPIAAVAADIGAAHRPHHHAESSLDECAKQRTPFFFPTPADLAFARRLCAREGLPPKRPYFDLPW